MLKVLCSFRAATSRQRMRLLHMNPATTVFYIGLGKIPVVSLAVQDPVDLAPPSVRQRLRPCGRCWQVKALGLSKPAP